MESAQKGAVPVRILIVEDEPLIRVMLAEELSDAGFDVDQAASGDEAAALVRDGHVAFGLLITDIHMPGTHDGVAVARLMRQQVPLLPVLYVSGRPDIFNTIRPPAQNDAFLAKPFRLSDLVRIVHSLLGDKGGHREN